MTGQRNINFSQWGLVSLIIALGLCRVLYSLLVYERLEQTAALYIGFPAIIAVILALTPKAKTVTGMILKGMTIALLAAAIWLQEGLICILLSAPLFYLVGVIIGMVTDLSRRAGDSRRRRQIQGLLILPFLLMSTEGLTESLSFPRTGVVSLERVINAPPAAVEAALSQEPRFDQELPILLRSGFPRPVAARGSGLDVGDQRIISFKAGRDLPGDLVLEVTDRQAHGFRLLAVSDSSEIARWLRWQEIEVNWSETSDGQTLVTWTIRYERLLDPAWYFGPLQHHAVGLATGYLIDTLATPH